MGTFFGQVQANAGINLNTSNLDVPLSSIGSSASPLEVCLKQHETNGTLGSLDAVVTIDPDCSVGTAVFQISGTWKGKIIVEGAVDGVYNNLSIVQPGGTITFAGVNNDNQNGIYRVLLIAGYTKLRLRMSAYLSGTATCVLNIAPLIPTAYAWQLVAANLQMTANQATGSNLHTVVDSGSISVENGSGIKIYDEISAAYKGLLFNAGSPQICAQSYLHALAEGDITGHTPFSKLGYNSDIGAAEEDIWGVGGVYPWIAAAGAALEVVSSNGNDNLTGSGVQKVRVTYLDTDYSSQSQILDMNGVTPVPLTDTTILRVNSIRATQVGANGVAAGNITCRLVGGAATVYRQIDAGYTRGRGCIYTVPLGKTLYITSVAVSSGASAKAVRWTGRAQVDDNAPTVKINFFQPFFEMQTQDNNFFREFEIPIVIPATADLKMSAISAGAGSICQCSLRGWLE